MSGIPNLFKPVDTFGILTQHAGHSHKMAPAGGQTSHKMAAMEYPYSHCEDHCTGLPKQKVFLKIITGNQISSGQTEAFQANALHGPPTF